MINHFSFFFWHAKHGKQPALSSNAVDCNANLSKYIRGTCCQEHVLQIWQEHSYPWENEHDTGLFVLEKNTVVSGRFSV